MQLRLEELICDGAWLHAAVPLLQPLGVRADLPIMRRCVRSSRSARPPCAGAAPAAQRGQDRVRVLEPDKRPVSAVADHNETRS